MKVDSSSGTGGVREQRSFFNAICRENFCEVLGPPRLDLFGVSQQAAAAAQDGVMLPGIPGANQLPNELVGRACIVLSGGMLRLRGDAPVVGALVTPDGEPGQLLQGL